MNDLTPRTATVLLVEDNEDHVFLTREAFAAGRLKVDLHHVDNGVKCMRFLRKESPYEAAPTVDLVLLDIHMPLMNGFEVIEAIRTDDGLKCLPVVVMSTSQEDLGVKRMYALGCNSNVKKPVSFSGFTEIVSQIAGYWFQLVVLPPAEKRER